MLNNEFAIACRMTGLAIVAIGLAQIAAHLAPAAAFVMCGTSSGMESTLSMFAGAAHCRGCPATLLGLVMIALSFVPGERAEGARASARHRPTR